MKKVFCILALSAIILLGAGCNEVIKKSSTSVDKNYKQADTPYSDSVVCTLKASAATKFDKNKKEINTEASIDDEPTTVTIVDLNSNNPSIVGNLGDKTTLVPLQKTLGAQLYLAEITSSGNINIWTLLRDSNILILSKQYDLMGMPFGLLMMGDCLSGA